MSSKTNRGRFGQINTSGKVNVGRPYVQAAFGVPENVNPGQWVRVMGQKKFSRLAANNRLVDPTGGRPAERTVSMAAFRLACLKSPSVVLRVGIPRARQRNLNTYANAAG